MSKEDFIKSLDVTNNLQYRYNELLNRYKVRAKEIVEKQNNRRAEENSLIQNSNDSPVSISPLPPQSEGIKKSIYTRQALKILYVDPEYIKMLKSETRGLYIFN